MAIIKKNIWFIFYVLLFIATVLFSILCYGTWNNSYTKHQTSQENIVELIANTTHSLFNTYERLTDILGKALLENNLHNIHVHVEPLIQNPEMVALGITTPEGDFIYATSDKDPTNIPHLLKLPETHDSFIQALSSEGMVFGRTYFSPPLQKWGMPIRKTIRNEAGEPQFVITTVLKHTSTFDALFNTLKHRHYLNLSIIRDHDLYDPEHGHNLDMLLRASDIAMYESKKIKNSAHIFVSEMQEGFLKNVTIEQELRKAMNNHELFMVYQPQINDEGYFYGAEALIRWNSPTLGNVPPNHFIPLAEASGLMPKIGRLIIEMVCEDVNEIHHKLQRPFHVSINISVRQFMDPLFLEHMLNVFEKTQTQYLHITLEVTENLFIEDLQYILPLLHKIRAMGIEISMDDFGTGYSSLSMLRQLPINELKIDKSFVDAIAYDITSAKMVQNIITIGKNLNMHVLAEGVETKEQKEILSTFGCDRFQGYYFSKPLLKEDLLHFLQS